jgi:transcriptional regulator with XRE-family HTH domain
MFANKLREFREKKGISLSILSKKTGIPATTLSKYERGVMAPKIDALCLLCRALKCSPNQVLEFGEDANFDPRVLECAKIIKSMGSFEQEWVLLTLEGIKMKSDTLKKRGLLSKIQFNDIAQ